MSNIHVGLTRTSSLKVMLGLREEFGWGGRRKGKAGKGRERCRKGQRLEGQITQLDSGMAARLSCGPINTAKQSTSKL